MPVLRDPNRPKYYNKLHKRDAWEEITKAMGTVPDECKKNLTSFLSSFRIESGRMRKSCGTGKGMYACCIDISTNKNVTNIPKPHYGNILRMVLFT
jgi:hypothetical protein